MDVNWFTVIAQVINFIILVWLLKRFLYKPILKAIDEREGKIALQIKSAEEQEALAKEEKADFSKKNASFDKEKKALMDEAIAEIDKKRKHLLKGVRSEAKELRANLDKALTEMQEEMKHDLTQKTQKEVFAIARKTLSDLASLSLEEQSTNIFIKRLSNLTIEEKTQFIDAFKSGSNQIVLKSAFELPEKQQTEIKNVVKGILGNESVFQFETEPEIVGGIELLSNGYQLAWSISEYLNSLQRDISETLINETKKVEPKPKAEKGK